METLRQISDRQECDKSDNMHTFYGESYPHVYERYFSTIRDKKINLLELGVWQGKSLRMWREYFPNAKIVGVDINPSALCHMTLECDVRIISQDDSEELSQLSTGYGGWDVVIDDASHLNHLTKKSFDILWKFVKSGGLYIIEDLKASYMNLSDLPDNWNGVNLHPEKQDRNNDREILNKLFLEKIRQIDYAKGDVRSIHFYHQMAIIEKI